VAHAEEKSKDENGKKGNHAGVDSAETLSGATLAVLPSSIKGSGLGSDAERYSALSAISRENAALAEVDALRWAW